MLKEWDEKADWLATWMQTLSQLKKFVEQHHATGLVWSGMKPVFNQIMSSMTTASCEESNFVELNWSVPLEINWSEIYAPNGCDPNEWIALNSKINKTKIN